MPGALQLDLITGFLSFLFTLLVLSYVVGDNPAFRLAIYAFAGVSAGYIVVVVLQQIIMDKMILPLAIGNMLQRVISVFPLVLSLFLLGKMSSRFEWLGRPVVALLVGVGTAVAVSGAVLGTLFPQILAGAQLFDPRSPSLGVVAGNALTGALALAGTVVTLAYFQFTSVSRITTPEKRGRFMGIFSVIGQVFIAITLGAIFAGVLVASLTALVDRVQSLIMFVQMLLSLFIR